jgi:hypothetical protein
MAASPPLIEVNYFIVNGDAVRLDSLLFTAVSASGETIAEAKPALLLNPLVKDEVAKLGEVPIELKGDGSTRGRDVYPSEHRSGAWVRCRTPGASRCMAETGPYESSFCSALKTGLSYEPNSHEAPRARCISPGKALHRFRPGVASLPENVISSLQSMTYAIPLGSPVVTCKS